MEEVEEVEEAPGWWARAHTKAVALPPTSSRCPPLATTPRPCLGAGRSGKFGLSTFSLHHWRGPNTTSHCGHI